MKHRCIDVAARWLTGDSSGVMSARRGHRNCVRMAVGPRESLARARQPVRGAIRGAILVRLSHFESRHGRIAATCWISNCRRLASNSPRTVGQRHAFSRQLAANGVDRSVISPIRFLRRASGACWCFRALPAICSDCFSNRLCKTRGYASNGRLAFKPTCTAVNFFHT
jgi:hypothetical protein